MLNNPEEPFASFFDLDHTLLRINSSYYFGKYLYRQNYFSVFQLLQLGWPYFLHKTGALPIAELHRNIFKKLFYGQPLSFFREKIDLFVQKNFENLLYLPAIQQLRMAQDNGHFIAILSNSPDFIVEACANQLGIKNYLATSYAVDSSGCFTSINQIVEGCHKAQWAEKAARERGIKRENISVYTDSILDLPFLQIAGTKVAVNPDYRLNRLCLKNKWKVI